MLQAITDEAPEKMALVRLLPAGPNARPMNVPLKKHRWLQKLPLGSPLQVRSEVVAERLRVVQLMTRPDGQPWDTRPAARPAPTATATKAFEGVLRVQAAGFGFVEGVFIPARFISQQDW